jgi:hypothetical protein
MISTGSGTLYATFFSLHRYAGGGLGRGLFFDGSANSRAESQAPSLPSPGVPVEGNQGQPPKPSITHFDRSSGISY